MWTTLVSSSLNFSTMKVTEVFGPSCIFSSWRILKDPSQKTLSPEEKWPTQWRQHFQMHCFNWKSLYFDSYFRFVSGGSVDHLIALNQEMPWCWRSKKPLCEPTPTLFTDAFMCHWTSKWYETYLNIYFPTKLLILMHILNEHLNVSKWHDNIAAVFCCLHARMALKGNLGAISI